MAERFVRSLAALDLRIYAALVGLVAAGVVQWRICDPLEARLPDPAGRQNQRVGPNLAPGQH